jgi:uncharacterized membrane protein YeaQ/YmgE (transglycosylase-associated protein family)
MNDSWQQSALILLLLYFAYGAVCGAFASAIANAKGRDGASWFFAGLLFGVIGLLAAGFMPDVITEARNQKARPKADGQRTGAAGRR